MSTFYGGYDLTLLRSADAWRALAPDLHLGDAAYWQAQQDLVLDQAALDALNELMLHEGYFQTSPVDWQLPLFDMANLIHTLRQLQIPPVFAFVYDEFWLACVKMAPVLARILGDDYVTLPNMWAWHIDPTADEHGWKAHRDRGRKTIFMDGRPKILSTWLPLTDATPTNGCMYVVPADRDPTYNTVDEMNLRFELQDIRALPAAAGSILAWNQAVLHWGAHSAPRNETPRISIGAEFQRRDVEAFSTPFLDPRAMLTFEARLQIIAEQFKRYRHHHPDDEGLAFLADHLIE